MSTTHPTRSTAVRSTPGAVSPTGGVPTNGTATATGRGILAIVLTGVALLLAPALLLVPYVGFAPALTAAAGVVIAATGVRRAAQGRGVAVAGLVVSALLFVLLLGSALLWNVVVADPSIRDYSELHEAIAHVRSLVFGS